MKYVCALAPVLFALSASGAAAQPPGLGFVYPSVCASGFHTDAGGNCQPNIAEESRYCPRGTVFHPTFDSWSCDPPPPEAY